MKIDEILMILPKSLVSIIILFLATKLIGKKQVAELSLFDYVIGISIGNFGAEMIINLDTPFLYGCIAIISFGVIACLVTYITSKNLILRKIIIGTPSIVIQKGKILINELNQAKMDVTELLEQLRINGYFDISQIEYAIVEANGQLSIMPKVDYEPIKLHDMNIKSPQKSLVANVIIDSEIINQSLSFMGKNQKWLEHELSLKGYKTLDNILLATLDINEKLVIYEKNQDIVSTKVLE